MPIFDSCYEDLLILLPKYFDICHFLFIRTATALIDTSIVSHPNPLSSLLPFFSSCDTTAVPK